MSSPSDCKYSQSHEWHRLSGDTLTLGITRYAVDALTDVTYCSIKPVGHVVKPASVIGEVESVKTTSDIYCACGGTITEVNTAVVDNPALLNADPYANWLLKIKVTDKGGFDKLMDAAAYDKAHPTH
jgi:glycine cleavage system H protein